jgi:hypothetical protein
MESNDFQMNLKKKDGNGGVQEGWQGGKKRLHTN